MIYDEVSFLHTYISLNHGLTAAMQILEAKQWKDEPLGFHPTDNARITCELVAYENSSQPGPYQVFEEKTRLYVVIEGEELMGISWREHARSLSFDGEGQATLIADPIGVIHAKSGHFALFMPGEPHTSGMESPGKKALVRKLIFTISD